MSDVLESRWFKVSVLIFSGVTLAYSAWELSIAIRLKNYITTNPSTTAINISEVNWSFWISIIVMIISLIFFIWAITKLLFSRKYREQKATDLNEWLNSNEALIGETTEEQSMSQKASTKPGAKTEIIERVVRPCDPGTSANPLGRSVSKASNNIVRQRPPPSRRPGVSFLYPDNSEL